MTEDIPEIGIVETRQVIQTVRINHSVELDDWALTSLKHRIEKIIFYHKLKSIDYLNYKLKADPAFFELFMKEITVGSTEMFRDPSLWRHLREEIFHGENVLKKKNTIWIPSCVSGDELFSLCILLKEIDKIDEYQITASYLSDRCLNDIKEGLLPHKKLETSEKNYIKSHGLTSFSQYYEMNDQIIKRNYEIIKNTSFVKQEVFLNNFEEQYGLILYRNKLIYCNPAMENRIINKLDESIVPGGFLILGEKEKINDQKIAERYEKVYHDESIYRKKK